MSDTEEQINELDMQMARIIAMLEDVSAKMEQIEKLMNDMKKSETEIIAALTSDMDISKDINE